MTLEAFVKQGENTGLVNQIYQREIEEPKKTKDALRKAARPFFTEAQLDSGAHTTEEGMTYLHDQIGLADKRWFERKGKEYVAGLDNGKLKKNVTQLRPVEIEGDEEHNKYFKAHERAYQLSQDIATVQRGGEGADKARGRLIDIENKEVKRLSEKARAEKEEELARANEEDPTFYFTEEDRKLVANKVEEIEINRVKARYAQLREKDPLEPARDILDGAVKELYDMFPDGDARDRAVAEYARKGIMALYRTDASGVREAISFVRAIGK